MGENGEKERGGQPRSPEASGRQAWRQRIGVRWTMGDVSDRGFEALRLSIWGAWRIFGPEAVYAVCVNSLRLEHALARTGSLPSGVLWHDSTRDVPRFLRAHLDRAMAEGVGWKLAPLRLFPELFEISLDNDCVLWELPGAMRDWLAGAVPGQCLLAEDVRACFGAFSGLCGQQPLNAGLRGLPPGFDYEGALRTALGLASSGPDPVVLRSELDEQGLQAAALSLEAPIAAVSLEDVSICSPFHPHRPELGRCGAHFVGLNARHIAWDYFERPADDWMTDHWERYRPVLERMVHAE